jgi:hypothetical protein
MSFPTSVENLACRGRNTTMADIFQVIDVVRQTENGATRRRFLHLVFGWDQAAR